MAFLIDTMVLSETLKNRPNELALSWMNGIRNEEAFVSVVTLGEIERGIRKLQRVHGGEPIRQKRWLGETIESYGRRVLPVSISVARRWGALCHDLRSNNPDLLIAATAIEHDLVVATRNVRHFEPTGAKLFNPYEA